MEPGFNAPRNNPEITPSLPSVNIEVSQSQNGAALEQAPQQFERELPIQDGPQGPTLPPVAVAAQPVAPVVAVPQVEEAAPLLSSTPDVAADDDRIEREWVDKAKKIITETADDPYRREQAIGQLQREYRRKRYGESAVNIGDGSV